MTAPASNNNRPREYIVGSVPRSQAIFKNSAGAAVNPGTVRFKFKKPDGNVTTWVYGTDPEISLDAETDTYAVELPVEQVGDWFYRWESTGNYQAAAERKLIVLASQVE